MGEKFHREIPIEEATASWYDEVYLPLVQVIRDQATLKEFPGRTEADLYLWIIEHLWYLREELNRDVSLKDAAQHFTDTFSSSPLRYISNLFKQISGAYSDSAETAITPRPTRPDEGKDPPPQR